MNAKPTTKYDPEAYRPDTVKPMPKESSWIYRSRRLYPKPIPTLPWGHYHKREPADTLGVTKPEGPLYNLFRMFSEQKRVFIPPPEKWWLNQMFPGFRVWSINHKRIKFKGISFWGLLIFIVPMAYLGVTIFDFLLPPPTSLVPYVREVSGLRSFLSLIPAGVLPMLILLMLLHFFSFPPRYILDRPSGKIIVRRFLRLPVKIPFTYFDAFFAYTPDKSKLGSFLRCRYKNISFAFIKLESQNSVYLVWQFIQRFMDVTQPLPDIPSFEPYRHLDPTTAAHDRETGRPERYWRDKSMEEINDIAAKMAEEEKKLNLEPVWPCTLAPFIEGRNPKKPTFFPKSKEGGR